MNIKSNLCLLLAVGLLFPLGLAAPRASAAPDLAPQTALPHPLLNDVNIRRAVAYCTDRETLIDSVYPTLSSAEKSALLIDSFLSKDHWAYSAPPPEFAYPFDPAQGAQLLEDAGWTLDLGATYRTNDSGYELAFSLTTTTASFRVNWTSALEQQLRDNCGIRLVRRHIPASVLFGGDTGLVRRDFETTAFAWIVSGNPAPVPLYGCDYVPTPENGWSGQNFMGWCNLIADQALTDAHLAWTRAEILAQAAILQDEFARDLVSLPVFHRTSTYAADSRLAQFSPSPSEPLYLWNAHLWSIAGEDTLRIGSTQEPASLWQATESSYISALVSAAVYGQATTSLNYDLQAQLYTAIPTIENGGILTQTVAVSQGERVLDATGTPVDLLPGMQVIDVHGQLVTYTSGTLDMVQISFATHYLDGAKWPDGSSLSQDDLRLWDEVTCYHNPSACENIAERTYLGETGVSYTMLPGYRDVLKPILPGAYPANRLLSDDRLLKDVPLDEWSSLPEINENPVGLGPYYVDAWQMGEYIRLARNPHYVLGQPLTPYLEIVFGDEPGLQDMLAARTIHVLDSFSLSEITATLQAAIDSALVDLYNLPSTTWEHIDFNLDLYSQLSALSIGASGGVLTNTLGVTVDVPAGAFDQDITLLLQNTHLPAQPLPGSVPLLSFSLEALDAAGQPVTTLANPITLTITYTDEQIVAAGLDEADLNLAYWNGSAWEFLLPCAGCSHDLDANLITVALSHLSDFSLAAVQQKLFLPLVIQ